MVVLWRFVASFCSALMQTWMGSWLVGSPADSSWWPLGDPPWWWFTTAEPRLIFPLSISPYEHLWTSMNPVWQCLTVNLTALTQLPMMSRHHYPVLGQRPMAAMASQGFPSSANPPGGGRAARWAHRSFRAGPGSDRSWHGKEPVVDGNAI